MAVQPIYPPFGDQWVGPNSKANQMIAQLRKWTNWLDHYSVQGYLGELGWPNEVRDGSSNGIEALAWKHAMQGYLTVCDVKALWMTAYVAGTEQIWRAGGTRLTPYSSSSGVQIDQRHMQADLLEAHTGTRRGVNISNLSAGFDDSHASSNLNPFSAPHYQLPVAASITYLADHGVQLIRCNTKNERLVNSPGGSIDTRGADDLHALIALIHAAGMTAVFDLHNGAGYSYQATLSDPIQHLMIQNDGGPYTSASLAADWATIAAEFKTDAGLVGYDLLNEPDISYTAANWESWSQACCDAIRAVDTTSYLIVEGLQGGIRLWSTNHPAPWITDAQNKVVYSAHHYFDDVPAGNAASGANYARSFSTQALYAAALGY